MARLMPGLTQGALTLDHLTLTQHMYIIHQLILYSDKCHPDIYLFIYPVKLVPGQIVPGYASVHLTHPLLTPTFCYYPHPSPTTKCMSNFQQEYLDMSIKRRRLTSLQTSNMTFNNICECVTALYMLCAGLISQNQENGKKVDTN